MQALGSATFEQLESHLTELARSYESQSQISFFGLRSKRSIVDLTAAGRAASPPGTFVATETGSSFADELKSMIGSRAQT
jgi:hypothetical protein